MERLEVIDSHTEGEPTRVVIAPPMKLEADTAAERRDELARCHDEWRRALILEPRGHEAIVGAYLLPPVSEHATAQVVFFNNKGYLGMCGHGAMGVLRTLRHLGRIGPGRHRIETPVGDIQAEVLSDETIAIENVTSFRCEKGLTVQTRDHGPCTGDIAWGGNWFFLVERPKEELRLSRLTDLLALCRDIQDSLEQAGAYGEDGAVIDHIELYAPMAPRVTRNFVLCPGGAWDRSPCGTGTSAKLACLAADGVLAPGEIWTQQSLTGGLFRGTFEFDGGGVKPTILGRAWVTAESTLLFDAEDPLREGWTA